jgi:hypothetical protein
MIRNIISDFMSQRMPRWCGGLGEKNPRLHDSAVFLAL